MKCNYIHTALIPLKFIICVRVRERACARAFAFRTIPQKCVIKNKEMKSAPYPLISLIQEVNWLYLGGGK